MEFWIGWLCGLTVAWLQGWLWRYLRRSTGKKTMRPGQPRARPLTATQKEWAMTRNFLYYDGTDMPPIHTYKEEQDE